MKLKDREGYLAWKAENADTPLRAVAFECAESWADLLEDAMVLAPGVPPHQIIADESAHCRTIAADVDGITPFALMMAANLLMRHWVHGRALRDWYRTQSAEALRAYAEHSAAALRDSL